MQLKFNNALPVKNCWRLGSNHGYLVSEATALPTVPYQTITVCSYFCVLPNSALWSHQYLTYLIHAGVLLPDLAIFAHFGTLALWHCLWQFLRVYFVLAWVTRYSPGWIKKGFKSIEMLYKYWNALKVFVQKVCWDSQTLAPLQAPPGQFLNID